MYRWQQQCANKTLSCDDKEDWWYVLQTNLDPRAWGELADQVEVGTSLEEPSAGGDLDTHTHTHTINTVTLITVELREKTVGNFTGWES